MDNSSREALAEYAHNAWTGWMVYLFSKGEYNRDGTWTMPAWAVERWQRQAATDYSALSEQEKESDRAEADKMLAIVRAVALPTMQTIGHCNCDGASRSVVFDVGGVVRCGRCGAQLTVTP